jgi:hypothetical protein
LAWETSADFTDSSAPRLPVKCADIIPDWAGIDDAISHPLEQHIPTRLFDFNQADAGSSAKLSSEYSAPVSSKQVKLIYWFPFLFF